MFIVGDVHQRIYDNHVSLARVGVNVRGRSKRLTVNYRTTQEILALAVPALGKSPVTGLDDEADTLTGYRSPLHGRRPKVVGARTREAEYDALVRQVTAWRAEGVEPHAQDLQRERCLLFVALTRARDHLYISYSGTPSSFLGWNGFSTRTPE